jgi:hypothetical protein
MMWQMGDVMHGFFAPLGLLLPPVTDEFTAKEKCCGRLWESAVAVWKLYK